MAGPDRHPLESPVELADLVDYQAGAVVSRTLVRESSGSLTLFAFDQGQGLSEHSTPHEAVVTVLDGQAEVRIADRAMVVVAGSTVRLPAGIPHALHAPVAFKMALWMLKRTAPDPEG